MPLHRIVESLHIFSVLPDQERRQIVRDHRSRRVPSATAIVRVARAAASIFERNSRRYEMKMAVAAVLGINQYLIERHVEQARFDRRDAAHGPTSPRIQARD